MHSRTKIAFTETIFISKILFLHIEGCEFVADKFEFIKISAIVNIILKLLLWAYKLNIIVKIKMQNK